MKDRKINQQQAVISASFHKLWLNQIRKSVTDCMFLSHVQYKNGYGIKAVMKNDNGGKDTITIPLNVNPSLLTSADYKSIMNLLKTKQYEQGSNGTLPQSED